MLWHRHYLGMAPLWHCYTRRPISFNSARVIAPVERLRWPSRTALAVFGERVAQLLYEARIRKCLFVATSPHDLAIAGALLAPCVSPVIAVARGVVETF